MYIADTLRRAYLPETNESLVPELEVNEVNLIAHLPISPDKYVEFKKATAEDQVMQLLQDTVFDGWPNTKAELPVDIRPYWTYRDQVSCVDGLLFKGNKLVVFFFVLLVYSPGTLCQEHCSELFGRRGDVMYAMHYVYENRHFAKHDFDIHVDVDML